MKIIIGKYPKRTAKIQIDDADTWSLNHTLATIIYPALVKFKQDCDKEQYSFVEDVDVPEHLRGDGDQHVMLDELTDEQEKMLITRWQWVLNEMIFSFSVCSDTVNPEWTWDNCDRVKNGQMLFGKYFNQLWRG